MKEAEIRGLFEKVVQDKAAMKAIGATKYQVYNYKNPTRAKTSLGTMLEVLFKLGHLQLHNYVSKTNGDIIPIKNYE